MRRIALIAAILSAPLAHAGGDFPMNAEVGAGVAAGTNIDTGTSSVGGVIQGRAEASDDAVAHSGIDLRVDLGVGYHQASDADGVERLGHFEAGLGKGGECYDEFALEGDPACKRKGWEFAAAYRADWSLDETSLDIAPRIGVRRDFAGGGHAKLLLVPLSHKKSRQVSGMTADKSGIQLTARGKAGPLRLDGGIEAGVTRNAGRAAIVDTSTTMTGTLQTADVIRTGIEQDGIGYYVGAGGALTLPFGKHKYLRAEAVYNVERTDAHENLATGKEGPTFTTGFNSVRGTISAGGTF